MSFSLLDALTSFLLAPQPWDNPELFFDQAVAGIATGSIYGLVALGIVLIYRSTDAINFAQGEMALFVTFVGWSLCRRTSPTSSSSCSCWPLRARLAPSLSGPSSARSRARLCSTS